MKWFSNPIDIAEKNRRIDELERQLESVTSENNRMRNKLKQIDDANRTGPFSFDFNAVKAFSVERNTSNEGNPVTVIGYLLPIVTDGKETFAVKEWYLYCDQTQHEAIVKSFKDSRK